MTLPNGKSGLIAICERAIYKNSEQRYQSSKELAEEVRRFQAGSLVQAYEYRFSEHLRRFAVKHQAVLAACTVGLLLVFGVGIFYNLQLIDSRDRERNQRIVAENNELLALRQKKRANEQKVLALDAIQKLTVEVPQRLSRHPEIRSDLVDVFGENIALLDRILDMEPDVTNALKYRFTNMSNIGKTWIILGNSKRAFAAFEDAISAAQELLVSEPDNPLYQQNRATSFGWLAIAYQSQGLHNKAIPLYRRAAEAQEALALNNPDRPWYYQFLAVSYENLGVCYEFIGDYEQAVAEHQASMEIRKDIAARFPEIIRFQSELGDSYMNLGSLRVTQGSYDEAIVLHKRAIAIKQELAKQDVGFRLNLGMSFAGLGRSYAAKGNHDEALAALENAKAIQKVLTEDDESNAELLDELSQICINLASLHYERKEPEVSISLYQDAIEIYERLLEEDSNNFAYKSRLAACNGEMANVLLSIEKYSQAALAVNRAIEIHSPLLESVVWRHRIGESVGDEYQILAKAMHALKLDAETLKAAGKAMEIYELLKTEDFRSRPGKVALSSGCESRPGKVGRRRVASPWREGSNSRLYA